MGRSGLKRTLEQEVLKQAQAYSDWKEQDGVHSFEDIEAKALEVAREVARALMSYGVADEQQVERQERPGTEPRCPECGRAMRYGGRRRKTMASKAGEIGLERDYYHCPGCGTGLFPPG
jgi:ribosomal protein S27AE